VGAFVLVTIAINPENHCSSFCNAPTDGDDWSYRNVCNMSLISFSLAVIFIIRLF